MNHYIDITILPDPDMPDNVIRNALFSKLHRQLHEHGNGEVGVSFPQGTRHEQAGGDSNQLPQLGHVMRLHGDEQRLQHFADVSWCQGLRSALSLTAIQPVPEHTQQVLVRRIRPFGPSEKAWSQRRQKRQGSAPDSSQRYTQKAPKRGEVVAAWLALRSQSNQQQFNVFIEQVLVSGAVSGKFSTYGLSSIATVPWF